MSNKFVNGAIKTKGGIIKYKNIILLFLLSYAISIALWTLIKQVSHLNTDQMLFMQMILKTPFTISGVLYFLTRRYVNYKINLFAGSFVGNLSIKWLLITIIIMLGFILLDGLFLKYTYNIHSAQNSKDMAILPVFLYFAPLGEEFLFRGVLYRIFETRFCTNEKKTLQKTNVNRLKYWKVAWIVLMSLIFVLLHEKASLIWYFDLFIFSILMYLIRIKSHGLFLPIIVHAWIDWPIFDLVHKFLWNLFL